MKALKVVNTLLSGVVALGIVGLGYTEYQDRQMLSGKEIEKPIVKEVEEVAVKEEQKPVVETKEKPSSTVSVLGNTVNDEAPVLYNDYEKYAEACGLDYIKEAELLLQTTEFLGFDTTAYRYIISQDEVAYRIATTQDRINNYHSASNVANIGALLYSDTIIYDQLVYLEEVLPMYYDYTDYEQSYLFLEALGHNLSLNKDNVAYMITVVNQLYPYGVAANKEEYVISLVDYDIESGMFTIIDVNFPDGKKIIDIYELAECFNMCYCDHVLEIFGTECEFSK